MSCPKRTCVFFILAMALLPLTATQAAEQTTVSGDSRIPVIKALFEEVVFGAEYKETVAQTVVTKWQGPVRISMQGKSLKPVAKVLESHIRELIKLTGLDINFVKPNQNGNNVYLLVVPPEQMASVPIPGAPVKLLETLAEPKACYFITAKKPADRIVAAWIVINSEREDRDIGHCIIEEITQAMGLPNDTSLVKETVFNNAYNTLRLHPVDRILVKTLYDKRLTPGMPKAQAMQLVETIIAEALSR